MFSRYESSEEYLSEHYKALGSVRSDYRNYNLYNLVLNFLKKGSVLDIGSGSGGFLTVLKLKGYDPYGLEPNQDLLSLASQRGLLNIKAGGIESLQKVFPDKRFDNVTMLDVLEHIEDDTEALKLVKEKLTSDGHLVIVVPAYNWLYGKRDEAMGHFRRYGKKELLQLMERSGFEIEKVRFWNMVGVLPYWFYEKVLRKDFQLKSRQGGKGGLIKKFLNFYIKNVENNFNLGFGLSLMVVGRPKKFN